MTSAPSPSDLARDPRLQAAPLIDGFRVLDPAVIYAVIGEDATSTVYRGRHVALDIDVAVKVLTHGEGSDGKAFAERFQHAARVAATVTHQNILHVMEVREIGGLYYLVTEFVAGETAAARVRRRGRQSEREALAILAGVAAGLAEAHGRGVFHGDVTPHNVLVAASGRVKVAGLGVAAAWRSQEGDDAEWEQVSWPGRSVFTAPEQWQQSSSTAVGDVWSLGAMFFHLCTGRDALSMRGGSASFVRRLQAADYPNLRNERPDLRPVVHEMFERCVRRDPGQRFANAGALLAELRRIGEAGEQVLADRALAAAVGSHPMTPELEVLQGMQGRFQEQALRGAANSRRAGMATANGESGGVGAPKLRRVVGSAAVLLAVAGLGWWWLAGTGANSRQGGDSVSSVVPVVGSRFTTGVGIVMLPVPEGTFRIGSPTNEKDRRVDEVLHSVVLTRPSWFAETEVTQQQWRQVMGTEPWRGRSSVQVGDAVAASYVTWPDAETFCAKLTESEKAAGRLPSGYRYALPTEAEWEVACRGGSSASYSFGDDAARLGQFAVFVGARSGRNAAAVRSRKPNALGLHDMHGNVWEWCADRARFDQSLVTETYRDDVRDPLEQNGPLRVIRGGGWATVAASCRSATRNSCEPDRGEDFLGFRPTLVAR